MRTLPNLDLQAFFALGEDGWNDEFDLNTLKVSVLTQGGFIDKVAATPGAPVEGDVYVFSAAHPTQANKVAVYDAATWKYFTPREGWLLYNRTANYFEKFDGAVWAELATGGAGLPAGGTTGQALVKVSNADGDADWDDVAAIAQSSQAALFVDEKASGTGGGAAAAGWNIRPLNTAKHNSITGSALAANVITLPAGTYRVRATAPTYRGNRHKLRIHNVTDAAVILHGTNSYTSRSAPDDFSSTATLDGVFTLAATKNIRLDHYIQTPPGGTGDFGLAHALGTVEVYASLSIERIESLVIAASGAAFPPAPAVGQRFYRTDRKIEYTYDGVRWLSTQLFSLTLPDVQNIAGSSTTYAPVPYAGVYSLYLESLDASSYRDDTGGTGEWDGVLQRRTAAGVDTTLATIDGAGDAAYTWLMKTVAISVVLDASTRVLIWRPTEISGSATYYASAVLHYRLIG